MVNTVAHLQSTFATNCRLDLTAHPSARIGRLETEQTMDNPQVWQSESVHLAVPLGNIRYGQTRDIFVSLGGKGGNDRTIKATLVCSNGNGADQSLHREVPLSHASTISDDEMAFHQNRSLLCRFIMELFARDGRGFIIDSGTPAERVAWFGLVQGIAAKHYSDKCNQALKEQVEGLIRQAAYADSAEWNSWGRHYLLGAWAAHAKQLRTTFLDPGVQPYDAESPLFARCQARLARDFEDEVVPPRPSRPEDADAAYSSGSKTLSLGTSYNSRSWMRSANAYSTPANSRGAWHDGVEQLDEDDELD